jgi:hypothetical protein
MNYLLGAAACIAAFVSLVWVLAGAGAVETTVSLDEMLES